MDYKRLLFCGLVLNAMTAAAQPKVMFRPLATQQLAGVVMPNIHPQRSVNAAETSVPQMPANLKLDDRLTSVVMSWDAVSTAADGSQLDPQNVTYTIYEVKSNTTGDSALEEIAAIKGNTQYEYPTNTSEGTPGLRLFAVKATTEAGDSKLALSPYLPSGKEYAIPFNESFANGNTSQFWWMDCDDPDCYGLLTDAAHPSADKDNGCFGFRSDTKGKQGTLVSHKLQLGGAANPMLSFSQFVMAGNDVPLTLEVQKPDGSIDVIDTFHAPEAGVTKWTVRRVSLAAYANERYIVLRFRFKADNPVITAVDGIELRDVKDKDIAAMLTTTGRVVKGNTVEISFGVKNLSPAAIKNYSVRLQVGDEVDKTVTETKQLAAYAERKFTYKHKTSSMNNFDKLPVTITVGVAGDNDEQNNVATATIDLEQTWRNPVEQLELAKGDGSVTLSWQNPKPNSKELTDGFESYSPWALQCGEWKMVDEDKATTGGVFELTDYPHVNEPMAFIVMNPSAVGDPMKAHSGAQFLGAPYAYYDEATDTYYPDASNWLISPELSGQEQTLTFWASNLRVHDMNGNLQDNDEIFYVLGSKTDTDIKSFKDYYSHGITHKFDVYGGEWTQFDVRLAEGTKYFAIHHTTSGLEGVMLMLDDFSFTAGGTPVAYNVYRDGDFVATVNQQSALLTTNIDGDHTYAVTAVYADGGESLPVQTNTVVTDGISQVSADNAAADAIYTVNGIRVSGTKGNLAPGLYIVSGKKMVIK